MSVWCMMLSQDIETKQQVSQAFPEGRDVTVCFHLLTYCLIWSLFSLCVMWSEQVTFLIILISGPYTTLNTNKYLPDPNEHYENECSGESPTTWDTFSRTFCKGLWLTIQTTKYVAIKNGLAFEAFKCSWLKYDQCDRPILLLELPFPRPVPMAYSPRIPKYIKM